MAWITNVSLRDIEQGIPHDVGDNTMLIQIVDPCMDFPIPQQKFKEVHQFEFLDLEAKELPQAEEFKCSLEQAHALTTLLIHALVQDMDVVVHCVAGVSRSGAVVEVGVYMGFEDASIYRSPNLLMKHRMLETLGLPFDPCEAHYFISNGVTQTLIGIN